MIRFRRAGGWREGWNATTATGEPDVNDGVHVVRLKRGKIAGRHGHLNTERVANALRVMAAKRFCEAAAAPIVD